MIWTTWSSRTIEAVAVILVLAGLVMRNFILAVTGFFIVFALWLGYFLARRAFLHLEVEWPQSRLTLEPGQSFQWVVDIANPLSVAAGEIQLRQDVPTGLAMAEGSRIDARFVLGGRQRARLALAMHARERGRWLFGPAELSHSDLWGWSDSTQKRPAPVMVTVWPRRIPFAADLWASARAMGDAKGQMWDEPDPSLYLGVRPYRPGDPLKWVHPFASARAGGLMIKEVERVRDFHIDVICHPLTSLTPWYGTDRVAAEECFTLSASAVESALHCEIACGLTISSPLPGFGHGISLPPALGPGTREECLTDLAWTFPGGALSDNLKTLLETLTHRAGTPGLILVVSPIWDPSLEPWLNRLSGMGHVIGWLSGGPTDKTAADVDVMWRWVKGRGIYAQHVSRGVRSVVDPDRIVAE